jgi:hypothetical protein
VPASRALRSHNPSLRIYTPKNWCVEQIKTPKYA